MEKEVILFLFRENHEIRFCKVSGEGRRVEPAA